MGITGQSAVFCHVKLNVFYFFWSREPTVGVHRTAVSTYTHPHGWHSGSVSQCVLEVSGQSDYALKKHTDIDTNTHTNAHICTHTHTLPSDFK